MTSDVTWHSLCFRILESTRPASAHSPPAHSPTLSHTHLPTPREKIIHPSPPHSSFKKKGESLPLRRGHVCLDELRSSRKQAVEVQCLATHLTLLCIVGRAHHPMAVPSQFRCAMATAAAPATSLASSLEPAGWKSFPRTCSLAHVQDCFRALLQGHEEGSNVNPSATCSALLPATRLTQEANMTQLGSVFTSLSSINRTWQCVHLENFSDKARGRVFINRPC